MINAGRRPPGLASERTALSWMRSLTGLVGVALLMARGALLHWPLLPAATAITAVGLLLLAACLLVERRRTALRVARPGPPAPGAIVAITVGVVLTAVLGGTLLLR